MQRTYNIGSAFEDYGTGKVNNISESVISMNVTIDSTPVYPGTVTAQMRTTKPSASYTLDVTDKCEFDWSNVNTHFLGTYFSKIKFNYGQKRYSNSIAVNVVAPQTG